MSTFVKTMLVVGGLAYAVAAWLGNWQQATAIAAGMIVLMLTDAGGE